LETYQDCTWADSELLYALRYERALVYENLGQRKRLRNELEKLYAKAPDYEDVAIKLGLK
jgi:lipoprotein NlpI